MSTSAFPPVKDIAVAQNQLAQSFVIRSRHGPIAVRALERGLASTRSSTTPADAERYSTERAFPAPGGVGHGVDAGALPLIDYDLAAALSDTYGLQQYASSIFPRCLRSRPSMTRRRGARRSSYRKR